MVGDNLTTLGIIPITFLVLESLHRTLNRLKHIVVHVWVTIQTERGNPVPNGCAARQEVRERTPVATSQGGPGDHDAVQAG